MNQKVKRIERKVLSVVIAAAIVITNVIAPNISAHAAAAYNSQAAIAYAETWSGGNRNPAYAAYSADCMNYVSQCLSAGGLEQTSTWKPASTAWINVPAFVNDMRSRGYQIIENPSASQIYPGNPVIFQWTSSTAEWSHATICVGYNEYGTPMVNGHTTDRTHVSWDYGKSSAKRMCTILINNGSSYKPVDLGNDFFAYLVFTKANKPLTNDNGNVNIQSKKTDSNGLSSQIWHFVRNNDGSYTLINNKDGSALDVYNAESSNRTNVWTYELNWTNAQRWYIYGENGSYFLQPACAYRYLDVDGGYENDGTNVHIYDGNSSDAQKFRIDKVNQPVAASIKVTPGTSTTNTVISWSGTADTDGYNVRISGTQAKDIWVGKDTKCEVVLPEGDYNVYVDSVNAVAYKKSNDVKFTVVKGTNPAKDWVDNGANESGKVLDLCEMVVETGELEVATPDENKQTEEAAPVENKQTEEAAPVENKQTEEVAPVENKQTENATPAGDNQVENTESSSNESQNNESLQNESPIEEASTEEATLIQYTDNSTNKTVFAGNTTQNTYNGSNIIQNFFIKLFTGASTKPVASEEADPEKQELVIVEDDSIISEEDIDVESEIETETLDLVNAVYNQAANEMMNSVVSSTSRYNGSTGNSGQSRYYTETSGMESYKNSANIDEDMSDDICEYDLLCGTDNDGYSVDEVELQETMDDAMSIYDMQFSIAPGITLEPYKEYNELTGTYMVTGLILKIVVPTEDSYEVYELRIA